MPIHTLLALCLPSTLASVLYNRIEMQQKRKISQISHGMKGTVTTTEGRPMTHAAGVYATLDDWIAHEAIPFSLDSRPDFNAAVDQVINSLGDSVAVLGFGEALHGGEELLILRNGLFQRLVEADGYSAIAIES